MSLTTAMNKNIVWKIENITGMYAYKNGYIRYISPHSVADVRSNRCVMIGKSCGHLLSMYTSQNANITTHAENPQILTTGLRVKKRVDQEIATS